MLETSGDSSVVAHERSWKGENLTEKRVCGDCWIGWHGSPRISHHSPVTIRLINSLLLNEESCGRKIKHLTLVRKSAATRAQEKEKMKEWYNPEPFTPKLPAHQALWATDQLPILFWNPVFTSLSPLTPGFLSTPLTAHHQSSLQAPLPFLLDVHLPWISALEASSLYICPQGYLTQSMTSASIYILMTPQICVLNSWRAEPCNWMFHRHVPYFLSPQDQDCCTLSPNLSW